MQKLPKAPDRKRGNACTKKEPLAKERSLFSVSAVTTPKSFLLLVEGAMCLSLDDALANLSNCLFYQQPTTKNTK